MKSALIGIAVILLLTFCVQAEDTPRPQVSEKPYQMMQKLQPLAGDWLMSTEVTDDDGTTWRKVSQQKVTLAFRHKDLILAEIPADTNSPGFHMETYITYDQYRESFRKAAIDDVWGVMDLYEGRIDGENLVLTNMKSGTFFPVGDNVWRGFRLTVELKSPERTMLVEKTDDDGSSWQPAFRVTYSKDSKQP